MWDDVILDDSYLVKSKEPPIRICRLGSLNFSEMSDNTKIDSKVIKINQLILESVQNFSMTSWMSNFVNEDNKIPNLENCSLMET